MREVLPQPKIPAHRQFLDHSTERKAKGPSVLLAKKTKIRVQGNPRSYNSHSRIPKRKKLCMSTIEMHFSQCWGWGSPRTSHQQAQCWRSARLSVGRWLSSRCVLTGGRSEGAPWGLCHQDSSPFLGAQPYTSHRFPKTPASSTITLWFPVPALEPGGQPCTRFVCNTKSKSKK